jgi:hypothetical protein
VRDSISEVLTNDLFLEVAEDQVDDILNGAANFSADELARYLVKAIDAGKRVDRLFAYLDWTNLSLATAEPLLERVERAERATSAEQAQGVAPGGYRTLVDLTTVLQLQADRKRAQETSQEKIRGLREIMLHAPGAHQS